MKIGQMSVYGGQHRTSAHHAGMLKFLTEVGAADSAADKSEC